MLEFILSYYFLILWGLSLSVLILLAIVAIYKKEFAERVKAIYERIVKVEDPHKAKFDAVHDDIVDHNICVLRELTDIKEGQIKIYDRLDAHDKKLDGVSSPLVFDVDELSQDIAETLSTKLREKKVDKLSKGS